MEKRIASYRVLEEIAAGGHASVYRVWDDRTGRVMALKVMHPHLARDADYVARFQREALMAASLDHPNVIHIYEVSQDGDTHFIAMEHLPLSLHDLLKGQGRLPVHRAVEIALQVAQGLEAAREKGIVHRDVKPQNVLIGADGLAKITDFGIARAEDLTTMTGTGMVLGTPSYIAPEQARGEPLDSRSDVYSLGVVLYQMLSGHLPFEGDTPWDVIRRHIEERAPSLREGYPEVPPELAAVVDRCLEKEPSARYATPQDLADALNAVREGLPAAPEAARPGFPKAAALAVSGGRWKWFAAGATLVAALVLFAAFGGGRISGFWSGKGPNARAAPVSTSTPTPRPADTPTPVRPPTPTATALPLRTPSPSPTATPAPTPQPTSTVAPTPTPVLPAPAGAVVKSVPPLRQGQTATIDLTKVEAELVGISRVELTAAEQIPKGDLSIRKAEQSPARTPPPGVLYSYLEIDLNGAPASSVKEARITFQVPAAWMRDHRPGGNKVVALYRYQESAWRQLKTTRATTDVETVTFTAQTPGFSLFAVTMSK